MKSIHLVFTALLLMVGVAGFGNYTADLDKNSKTDQVEIPQFEMQSVDFIYLEDNSKFESLFLEDNPSFDYDYSNEVISFKDRLSQRAKRIRSQFEALYSEEIKNLQSAILEPDKRNSSWHNFKIKKYTYHFTARLLKGNPIRILC